MAKNTDSPFIAKCRMLLQRATAVPNADASEADRQAQLTEAANAMSMLQSMLARQNIQMSDITANQEDGSGTRSKSKYDAAAMYKFQQDLMKALAHNNFCMYFLDTFHELSNGKMRNVKRHVLLGRDVNIAACTMMYDYLTSTMDRILPYYGMEKRGKDALKWLGGCTETLIERLAEKKRQMLEEEKARQAEDLKRAQHPAYAGASGGNALVLADAYNSEDDLNNDFIRGWEPGQTARNRAAAKVRAAEYAAQLDAKIAQLMLDDPLMPRDVARYLAMGYSREDAERYTGHTQVSIKEPKPETEAQRRKRERSERAWDARYYARQAKENARQNDPAFRAGRQKGHEIGLDAQVGHNPTRRL